MFILENIKDINFSITDSVYEKIKMLYFKKKENFTSEEVLKSFIVIYRYFGYYLNYPREFFKNIGFEEDEELYKVFGSANFNNFRETVYFPAVINSDEDEISVYTKKIHLDEYTNPENNFKNILSNLFDHPFRLREYTELSKLEDIITKDEIKEKT